MDFKLKFILSFFVLFFILLNQVFAEILFWEILPNTEDDTNLEYIELYNSWTLDKNLNWFTLKDKSEKSYIFSSWSIIWSGETKKFFRTQTKLLLNNNDEELYLYNNSWTLIDNFFYNTSIKWEAIKSISLLSYESNSWNIGTWSWKLTNTWNIDYTNSWSSNNLNIYDNFKVQFSFQNPTYILEKEKTLANYICDNSKWECKINLDLRNSFTWSFKESDFNCEINFGFEWWTNWQENKCNPSTIVYPKWSFDLKFRIIPKLNSSLVFTWGFLLYDRVEPVIIEKEIIKEVEKEIIIYKNKDSNTQKNKEKSTEKINIEIPKIIIQSWLDENNNCKKESCSINLKYEEKNKNELCVWDFSGWSFDSKTALKCNPWYVKYPFWNHKVKLKVYQKNNENNFKENILNFNNLKKEFNKKAFDNLKNVEKEIIYSNDLLNNNMDFKSLSISKIMPNTNGSDNYEYVELENKSNKNINLK